MTWSCCARLDRMAGWMIDLSYCHVLRGRTDRLWSLHIHNVTSRKESSHEIKSWGVTHGNRTTTYLFCGALIDNAGVVEQNRLRTCADRGIPSNTYVSSLIACRNWPQLTVCSAETCQAEQPENQYASHIYRIAANDSSELAWWRFLSRGRWWTSFLCRNLGSPLTVS